MIYLGADHGGFDLKEKIKLWLTQNNYQWEDLGNATLDGGDDYQEFAFKVAEKVAGEEKRFGNRQQVIGNRQQAVGNSWKESPKGVLLCRSAAGMVIAANKVMGIRAAAAFDKESAEHSRKHNNSNILALSGDRLNDLEAFAILKVWLETEFSNLDRYVRRLKAIGEYENSSR